MLGLERRGIQIKTIVIDPRIAGISGDMMVAALLDLGGSVDRVYEVAESIEEVLDYCDKLSVEVSYVRKGGIRARDVYLHIKEHVHEISAIKVKNYALKVGEKIGLSENELSFIARVFDELIMAESKVHGIPPNSVHFHEIASSDTVFDVVASAAILGELGYLSENAEVYSTPPALGGGFIEIEHGLLPVPAPATLEILKRNNFKISNTPIEVELTTPTGAALLVSLASSIVDFYPPIELKRVGYGAGKKDLGRVPNILRIIEGESLKATRDKVVVLETNLDDVTGEIIGYLVQKLINKGALDVSVIPALGKKNRPVHIIKILADPVKYVELLEMLVDETGTLGVRIYEIPRVIAERMKRTVKVKVRNKEYTVRVKVSRLKDGKLVNLKPEYEDIRRIAEDTGLPLRRVSEEVNRQIKGLTHDS